MFSFVDLYIPVPEKGNGNHYYGFNTLHSWDEWVGADRLMKPTEENVMKQQALDKKQGVDKSSKSGRSSQSKPKSSAGKIYPFYFLSCLFANAQSLFSFCMCTYAYVHVYKYGCPLGDPFCVFWVTWSHSPPSKIMDAAIVFI